VVFCVLLIVLFMFMFTYISIIKIHLHFCCAHLMFFLLNLVFLFLNHIILFCSLFEKYIETFFLAFVYVVIHVFESSFHVHVHIR